MIKKTFIHCIYIQYIFIYLYIHTHTDLEEIKTPLYFSPEIIIESGLFHQILINVKTLVLSFCKMNMFLFSLHYLQSENITPFLLF